MIAGDKMTSVPLLAPPPTLRFIADRRLDLRWHMATFQAAGVEDTQLRAATVIRAYPQGQGWGG